MKLTEHFSLEDFTRSDVAKKWKINNNPPKDMLPIITRTLELLERVQLLVGPTCPIEIWSGYRCPRVNTLVGGSRTSQHLRGEAVDIVCPEYGNVLRLGNIIAENVVALGVDQVICEYGRWVHISSSFKPRHQVFSVTKSGTFQGIV